MNYSFNDLPPVAVNLIFAGLGKLPYEDSHQLIAHLGGQIRMQDEAAKAPAKDPVSDSKESAELHDVAGDADELIK